MNGAEIIARALKDEGVDFIAGFPLNHVFDTAAALGIRPIIARTERVAVNIADGYSRMTGGRRPGVVAFQYGPGSENAFSGIAQAYSDSTPILCLAGATEIARFASPPNFCAGSTYKPITKWSETISHPLQTAQMVQHAMALLRSGRGGPVLLELPSDVLLADTGAASISYVKQASHRIQGGDPNDVEALADTIVNATCPVLYAGQGVLFAEAWDELKALAEATGMPVMTSLNGKSGFPENHPLSLGAANGFSCSDGVAHFLKHADLIVGVGTSFTISKFIAPIPAGKVIAQIVNDERDLSKDYPTSLAVLGDAKIVLRQLAEALRDRRFKPFQDTVTTVKSLKEAFLGRWKGKLTSDEAPINPYRLIWELMNIVDRDRTVVTHDAGSPRDQMVPFYESVLPRTYLSWGKSTPLGAGLGLIMGAKLARPDWLAVNVMGEAAFGMVGMDFETAVRERIPILTVVINNGRMGAYSIKQPVAAERYGLHKLGGNYSKVAQALGGHGERLDDPAKLTATLKRCIAKVESGTPVLLEAMCCEETALADAKSRH